jgi:tetratricopeptide (TPR) repeat protein
MAAALFVGVTGSLSGAETPLAEGRRAFTAQGRRYGELAPDHLISARVLSVFERVARAAGSRAGLALEVHVLDTPDVIAESLPGGLVVVSRGTVDLAGANDDALAFLLGHEIAHHLRDHYALLESLGVLGGAVSIARPTARDESVVRTYHAIELDADRLGVLYAALAGYRATAALPILTTLIERSGRDAFHPQPKERAAAVAAQIAGVAAHVEVFHAGLFLLSVGRSLEAAHILEHFLALFPSREVLLAVGVAYHREALRRAPPPTFRHVLVVDAASRAPQTKGGPDPTLRPLFERARRYYTLAADADPQYAPAWNNLGAVHLDLGEYDLALGNIARALKQAPVLAAAYVNRGAASAMTGNHAQAEEDWQAALRLEPGLRVASLNLAALYELRGRPDEARRLRARSSPPAPIDRAESVGGVAPGSAVAAVSRWLEEPGVRQLDVPAGGTAPDFKLLVLERRGVALLTRSNTVEAVGTLPRGTAVTATGLRFGDPAPRVRALYGAPEGVDAVQAMSLWTYASAGLAVVMVNDRVQSVWSGRKGTGR